MRRTLPKSIAAIGTGTIALLALLIAAVIVRLLLVVNLPIALRHTPLAEDGLYLRLAASLGSGHWLGPYDALTLTLGPGYPLLLAANALTGVPISATHALLQITAVAVAAWALLRLTGSKALAVTAFLVLVLAPVGLMPSLQRATAEQLTWAQALLVVSFAAVLLYAPPVQASRTVALGALLGVLLGWTWITRTDGAWLLAGLALLAGGAVGLHAGRSADLHAVARGAAAAGTAFAAVILLAMSANLAAYGKFTIFEAKPAAAGRAAQASFWGARPRCSTSGTQPPCRRA